VQNRTPGSVLPAHQNVSVLHITTIVTLTVMQKGRYKSDFR
jgi:hypothetical protein